jgi:predicted lipoprotein with Yx(FWY)xxD motif
MPKKIIAAAVAAFALAAAGAAAAAVVTHQSSASTGTVNLRQTKLGKVLAAKTGKTLYLFMADHNGRSACYGKCATFWPPLIVTGKPTAGTGVKAKLLGVTMRKDGKHQVTYNGHPLYTYVGDSAAGKTKGEGLDISGGLWWAVSPAGQAVKTTSSSSGGGGGGGYGGNYGG